MWNFRLFLFTFLFLACRLYVSDCPITHNSIFFSSPFENKQFRIIHYSQLFIMSFLCSLEVEFLVKPWLCSTCQGSGLRGWIWNGTAAATIGILCQIFFRSSWGYCWWWWLFYKKMMISHLSRFGSKSFAEEQLVLIEQHLYKLCDKACGSLMCISQIHMCQNSIEEVWEITLKDP